MITGYDIKKENNKNIAYLYLDFDYEFGSFNKENLAKNIKQYINIIKKVYKTNIIRIVVGGMVIATIFIGINNKDNDDSLVSSTAIEEIVNYNGLKSIKNIDNSGLSIPNHFGLDSPVVENEEKTIEKLEDAINEVTEETTNNTNSNVTPNNEISNTDSNITPNNQVSNTNSNVTPNNEVSNTQTENTTPSSTTTPPNDISAPKETEVVDNNTYVTVYRSNGTVLTIELEEYVVGVVASEMPASFNVEALKSQSVLARTLALQKIKAGKVITDTTSTQVYKDTTQLKDYWGNTYDTYYKKIKGVVASTKGEYATYNGNYIDVVYHSCNNGYTEDAINVWGYSIPYLKSVDSSWDKNTSAYQREVILDLGIVNSTFGLNINESTIIELIRNDTNHITTVKVENKEIAGKVFREQLGLRSTDFVLKIEGNNLVVTTYGYGHAVGMSQYGANEMAKLGYNYKDILHHYYQNININSL